MVAAIDLVNRALEQIGVQATITGFPPVDTSPAANAANVLYTPAVQMVLRESNWDAARFTTNLALTGIPAPSPWAFGYFYPADGIKIRYIIPAAPSVFDPQPVRWAVANQVIAGTPTKIIATNVAGALVVYTNQVSEALFDSVLQEAVVRALASSFSMALAGRPDFSKVKLEEMMVIVQAAENWEDS